VSTGGLSHVGDRESQGADGISVIASRLSQIACRLLQIGYRISFVVIRHHICGLARQSGEEKILAKGLQWDGAAGYKE